MQARTDLEDLDVTVRHRNGRYLASIPQLGLYATADSLVNASAALEAKKMSLLQELTEAGALHEISILPSGQAAQMRMMPVLTLFTAKIVIALIFLFVAGGIAWHIVRRDFDLELDRLHQATMIGGTKFWAGLEKAVEQGADPANDLPPAKKQELLAKLHIIVDRWRPFVRQAGRLFDDREETSPGNP